MTPLPMPDDCWPIDSGCCDGWDALPDSVQARAAALASQTLRLLTGFRVGGCPVTVRPCRKGCGPQTYQTFPVGAGGWWPVSVDGAWYNIGCACGSGDGCACDRVCEIVFTFDVTSVTAATGTVWVDGAPLDPSAYRVDGGNRLTRVDGDCWPQCQDMNLGLDQPGTFGVIVTPGGPVDGLGASVAGVLACEYAKACQSQPCGLPAGVTSVVRQGVSLQIASEGGVFPGGLTGIREVDAYIRRWNPNMLTEAPLVWSPDVKYPRVYP